MSVSPKYWRQLKDYEEKRYQTLLIEYKKLTKKDYNWIELEKWWTLKDIACSQWKYNKFYIWFRKGIEKNFKKIEKENQDKRNYVKDLIEEDLEDQEIENNFCEEDMKKANKQFENCFNLMKGRNKKYGNSWKQLRNSSLIDIMIMKLDRCQKQELNNKALEVEIEDIINYWIFTLINLRDNEWNI